MERTLLRAQEKGLEVIEAIIERLANTERLTPSTSGQSHLQALRDWREEYAALLEQSRQIVNRTTSPV